MADDSADCFTYIGLETLRRMSRVQNYNRWITGKMVPYVGRRILEVGGGIGTMADFFLDRDLLVLVDILPEAVEALTTRYVAHRHIHPIIGDIVDSDIVPRLADYQFDTAISVNVLEHIEQDGQALVHIAELLRPGGYLVLFVPASAYLYGTLDSALGHHRRYEAAGLRRLVERTALQVERIEYCNMIGILGWWLNSYVLQRDILPERQLRAFNFLAPVILGAESLISRLIALPTGQSLLCIARKV